MSNTFNLDAMCADVDSEYSPVDIEIGDRKLTLHSLLRVAKPRREQIYKLLEEMDKLRESSKDRESDVQALEFTEKSADLALQVLPLVASDDELAQVFVKRLEVDVPLTLKFFNVWMEATQAGEAKGSESS